MDDWQPVLDTEPDSPVLEKFDPTWPYNFKWGYDAQTGQTNVWRVKGGTDGRPTHRAELRHLWGREPQVREGDVLGLATYIPAEMKLDRTVVAPPLVQVQAYYGLEVPQGVFDYFAEQFPGAVVRRARLARKVMADGWLPNFNTSPGTEIKWAWNQQNGLLVWATDQFGNPHHEDKIWANWKREQRPDDFLGGGFAKGNQVEVRAYRFNTPSVALSQVKQQLAQMYPNATIEMPENQEAHEGLGVEFHGNPGVLAAKWARDTFGADTEMPLEGTQEPSNDLRVSGTTPRSSGVLNGLRKLFRKPAKSEADMDGAMIALFIPEETAKKLKVSGGEPIENMHITLCYFQDKSADRDDWDEVRKIVEQVANQTPKMEGKISGHGVFSNDMDVLWAAPSVQGLAELRHKLYEACEDAGFPINKDHDWVPHITLKYDHKGKLPKLDEEVGLAFDNLSFAQGNNRDDYDLTGNFEKKTAYEGPMLFVTDGKDVITDPDDGRFTVEHLADRFNRDYPDVEYHVTGRAVPTPDGMGYAIESHNSRAVGPGMHEIMAALDKHLGKPCHFAELVR